MGGEKGAEGLSYEVLREKNFASLLLKKIKEHMLASISLLTLNISQEKK
jgi:hypothetical protein